jgi:hypothetical protein
MGMQKRESGQVSHPIEGTLFPQTTVRLVLVEFGRGMRWKDDTQPRAQPDPPETQFVFRLSVAAGRLVRTLGRSPEFL